jgi:hypothetical protein
MIASAQAPPITSIIGSGPDGESPQPSRSCKPSAGRFDSPEAGHQHTARVARCGDRDGTAGAPPPHRGHHGGNCQRTAAARRTEEAAPASSMTRWEGWGGPHGPTNAIASTRTITATAASRIRHRRREAPATAGYIGLRGRVLRRRRGLVERCACTASAGCIGACMRGERGDSTGPSCRATWTGDNSSNSACSQVNTTLWRRH